MPEPSAGVRTVAPGPLRERMAGGTGRVLPALSSATAGLAVPALPPWRVGSTVRIGMLITVVDAVRGVEALRGCSSEMATVPRFLVGAAADGPAPVDAEAVASVLVERALVVAPARVAVLLIGANE